MTRRYIGLSIGNTLEGVDTVLVRVSGAGLSSRPFVESHLRKPLHPQLREALKSSRCSEREFRELAEFVVTTARQLLLKLGGNLRDVLAIGLMTPHSLAHSSLAEHISEQTGITLVTDFSARDQAAGGMGMPLTPAADFLLMQSETEGRLLLHLGDVSSVLVLPAAGKITDLQAFDAGPGNQLLDELVRLGTRNRDCFDPGGTKAVQGHCHEPMLREWLAMPFLQRKSSRLIASEWDSAFIGSLMEGAHRHHASLNDLLCTANHFIARAIAIRVQQRVSASESSSQAVYVSGGGVRNGFLWQLLQQQFEGLPLKRTDEIGLPALARNASAAAILTSLLLDGVSGNLPLLTGAHGGRLIGRVIPGDPRNWAHVTAWMAEQMWDYAQIPRAA